jgi:nitrogen-specific signal transduction histidine kinase/CheY-like chemotaxis protein
MTPTTHQNTGRNPVNRRILVVDDNPAIHSDIRKILCPRRTEDTSVSDLEGILFDEAPKSRDSLTFELFSAHQGQEALEMVRRSLQEGSPYALAFMDVRMPPGWDGIETISRIWEVDPSIQMVVCTAYSDYSWEEMRSRLGQPESLVVLKKPFDNVEVQQLAHALTRKWQLNVQAESATSQLEGVIDYMRSLLAREKRLAAMPLPRSGDIRYAGSTDSPGTVAPDCQPSPTPGPTTLPEKANDTGEHDGKQPLSDVLLHLKGTLESTFRQLRETEMQLVQAEKLASLGRLSAGIMHEINNPLNYAVTAVDLSSRYADAMREDARPEYLENLKDIKSGLVRISHIVRDLREFTGPQLIAANPIDVSHSLGVALRILLVEMPEGIAIENRIPAGFCVRAVSGRLTQIFLNLLHNSIDALREKSFPPGAKPLIRIEGSIEDGIQTIRIWDNGPGIPVQDRERIFDPFFTTKEVGRGTGLGLSICYRLLRDVGAGIRVRSEPGIFTEFILAFPGEPECRESAQEDPPSRHCADDAPSTATATPVGIAVA